MSMEGGAISRPISHNSYREKRKHIELRVYSGLHWFVGNITIQS